MEKLFLIVVIFLVSCTSTEEMGGNGQLCYENNTCNLGFDCINGVCVISNTNNNSNNVNNVNNTNNSNNTNIDLCGNGIIDFPETCDGYISDTDCMNYGYTRGVVSCGDDCQKDFSLCECDRCSDEASCNNFLRNPEMCGGCDNDCYAQGLTDCINGQCTDVKICNYVSYQTLYDGRLDGVDCLIPSASGVMSQLFCEFDCCDGEITLIQSINTINMGDRENCGGCGVVCDGGRLCICSPYELDCHCE